MPELQYRDCVLERTDLRAKDDTLTFSFASEAPVSRGSYLEVLDMRKADMSRLNNGGPLLAEHDRNRTIGVVLSTFIEGTKAYATVRFSKGQLGAEYRQDMADGIRKGISIGYCVGDELSRDVDAGGNPVIRYASLIYEISSVSIPADASVGVGRSATVKQIMTPTTDTRQAEFEAIGGILLKTNPAAKQRIDNFVAEGLLSEMTTEQFRKAAFAKINELKADTDTREGAIEIANIHNQRGMDLGAQFANSPGFKKFQESKGTQRTFAVDVNLRSPGNMIWRTTGDPATTTGLTSIDKQPGIVLLGVQPPRVADLMTQTPTGGTTCRYIQENSLATPGADFTAENGAYPEQTWDLTEVDASVRKVTSIARVTDEFFQDYDATRDYINTRLAYQIAIKEDYALLNAVASSTSIKGLLNFTGIQTQAQGGDTALNALYKGINKVRTTGFFEPDAIVLHPNDLQNFRLMTDKNGQYFFGGPFTGSYGQPGTPGFTLYIWGLPVVWTTSIAAGTALVGAFRMGAQIFRKLGLTIETTNSDASDFANGRIAVRATSRFALACYRPLAFCTVTGLN